MTQPRPTRTFILILACNAILLLMTKFFVLDIIIVRGRSMEPSLGEGTPLLVSKTAYGLTNPFTGDFILRWRNPTRGELVIFKSPLDGELTLKRCAAVAGDELAVTDDFLSVNGLHFPLKFYQGGRLNTVGRVPVGEIIVIGDNYAASSDSRTFGFVPVESVTGAAVCAPTAPEAAP
jgi:signal peptidase I